MEFKRQFYGFPNQVIALDDFEELPDFCHDGVPTISELIRSMSVGKEVDHFPEGIYEDDQVFDTEFIDVFDHLDKIEELAGEATASKRGSKASTEEKETPAVDDGKPPAE